MPEVQCALGQRHAERKGLHRRGHPRHLREGQGAAAWVAPVGSPTFLYIIKLVDPHRDPHGKLAAKRKSHPTGTQFSAGWRYAFTGVFFYCLQQRKMQRFTRHRKLTHTGADGGADQHPDTRENARKAAKQLGRKTALKDLFLVSARPCILKENVLM